MCHFSLTSYSYLNNSVNFIYLISLKRSAIFAMTSTVNDVLKYKSAELERASFHMKLCDRGFQNNGVPLGKLCS